MQTRKTGTKQGDEPVESAKVTTRLLLLAGSMMILGGCTPVTQQQSDGTDYVVKILFDTAGCPKDTMYDGTLGGFPELEADKDTISWQSYNADGTSVQQDQSKLYFDPFKNSSIDSKNDGSTSKEKTEKKANIPTGVFYKYTIWAKAACPDEPLDPRFKVL